ncbi:hypothetical protein IWX92DRAFT_166753 [Phyllosticta citricarpa]
MKSPHFCKAYLEMLRRGGKMSCRLCRMRWSNMRTLLPWGSFLPLFLLSHALNVVGKPLTPVVHALCLQSQVLRQEIDFKHVGLLAYAEEAFKRIVCFDVPSRSPSRASHILLPKIVAKFLWKVQVREIGLHLIRLDDELDEIAASRGRIGSSVEYQYTVACVFIHDLLIPLPCGKASSSRQVSENVDRRLLGRERFGSSTLSFPGYQP